MHRSNFLRLLVLLTALPGAALAECPARADLPAGIMLVQNAPFTSASFQASDLGLVEVRRVRQGERTFTSTTIYAHPLAAAHVQADPDVAPIRIVYHGDLTALDRLDTLGEVTMPVTATLADGIEQPGTYRARLTGRSGTAVGECGYDTWDVVSELAIDGAGTERMLSRYAPALGLVLNPARLDDDGAARAGPVYNWIGTAADIRR